MAEKNRPSVRPRRPTLGWLRVALAVMVMLFHYGIDGALIEHFLVAHPVFAPYLRYLGSGNLAVVGFFVISGYLVADVVERRHNPARLGDLLQFTASRWLRIFPLYVVLFGLYVVFCALWSPAQLKGVGPDELLSRLTLLPAVLQRIWPGSAAPLWTAMVPLFWGAAWTLPFDILFYPVGFLLMRDRRLILVTLGLGLLTLGLTAWHASGVAPPAHMAGVSIALDNTLDDAWLGHVYGSLTFLFTAFVMGMAGRLWVLQRHLRQGTMALCTLGLLVLAFFPVGITPGWAALTAMVLFSVLVPSLAFNGRDPQEENLGHYTYALYLVHQFVGTWALALVGAYWIGVKGEGRVIHPWRLHVQKQLRMWTDTLTTEMSPALAWIGLVMLGINVVALLTSMSWPPHP